MRWIKFLAALLLALLAIEGVARIVEPRLPPATTWSHPFVQAKYEQLEELREAGGAEVLVVGSSLVNANVDALQLGDALGVTAYNVGLPASNIPLWNAYLREIALERSCPGVVVIGVGTRDSNDQLPGFNGYVPRYRDSIGRRAIEGDLTWLEQIQVALEDVSAFVRLRPRLREPANVVTWLAFGRARGWTDTNLDDGGRYLGFADDSFPDDYADLLVDLRDRVMVDYEVGGRQFTALRRIVHAVRNAGAVPVFVVMPGMEEPIAEAMPNGRADLDRFREELAALASDMRVRLLDPSELNDRPELFADLYHMNQQGAEALTAEIAAWLAERDLPFGAGCTD